VVAAVIALAGAVVVLVGTHAWLTIRSLSSERRAGELSRALAVAEAALSIERRDHETQKRRADFQEDRANELDDLLAEHAADLDPAGARERVLARWRAVRGETGSGATGAVHSASTTVAADDLAKPGD
jgi:hypothetical protein